jgi:hypothetical protein
MKTNPLLLLKKAHIFSNIPEKGRGKMTDSHLDEYYIGRLTSPLSNAKEDGFMSANRYLYVLCKMFIKSTFSNTIFSCFVMILDIF